MPNVGLINLVDAENGVAITVDTSSKRIRNEYHKQFLERNRDLKHLIR